MPFVCTDEATGFVRQVRFAAALGLLSAVLVSRGAGQAQTRIDAFIDSRHHPAIAYGKAPVQTAVTRLNTAIERGERTLAFDETTGYLQAFLAAMDIPVTSQVLVYSPTSFQAAKIHQQNPRAIYFNDEVAVGWVRGGALLEVTAQDPVLGTIFYALPQVPASGPATFRREETCVSCHLTYDTLGVPGLTVRSTRARRGPGDYLNDPSVDHRTPYVNRWGGWFVTGAEASVTHLGNQPLLQPERIGPVAIPLATVDGQFDTTGYPLATSDVAALLVLEHQSQAANMITRLGWEARVGDAERTRIAAQLLADYLLFADEAPLPASLTAGPSPFAAQFAARGPFDRHGRTLRELQLSGRLMRYPLSYMIYSPMYRALPEPLRHLVDQRIEAVLAGQVNDPRFVHFTSDVRAAVAAIRADTVERP